MEVMGMMAGDVVRVVEKVSWSQGEEGGKIEDRERGDGKRWGRGGVEGVKEDRVEGFDSEGDNRAFIYGPRIHVWRNFAFISCMLKRFLRTSCRKNVMSCVNRAILLTRKTVGKRLQSYVLMRFCPFRTFAHVKSNSKLVWKQKCRKSRLGGMWPR